MKNSKQIYTEALEAQTERINRLTAEFKNGERDSKDFQHEMFKATWAIRETANNIANLPY